MDADAFQVIGFSADCHADLAIDGNGRFYVSHPIVHDQVRRAPDEFGTIVSTYELDGTPAGPLVHITASDLTTPRFVLPGYTEVRVTASGDRVAVFYPASGSVDVFHSGELETSIQVCMPRALARAYEQQRDDATVERLLVSKQISRFAGNWFNLILNCSHHELPKHAMVRP